MNRKRFYAVCLTLIMLISLPDCFAETGTPDISILLQEAEAGNADSMETLAECYENGEGTEQNLSYAAVWYLYAAEAGSMRAMLKLGEIYETGTLFLQNPEKAYQWYQEAAFAGSADGMLAVGRCTALGIGTYKSQEMAMEWFEKARAAGAENVDDVIDEIYSPKPKTSTAEIPDPERLMEIYTPVILQADTYEYHDTFSRPTGEYEYAVVKLNHDALVPGLLLRQLSGSDSGPVIVFQYDPESNSIIAWNFALYINSPRYFMFTDDETLCVTTFSHLDGDDVYYNYGTMVLRDGTDFVFEEGMYGRMKEGETPDNRELADLVWHNIKEISRETEETGEAEDPGTAVQAEYDGGTGITLDQLDETVRSYYQAMINEKERFDYQDYGEGAAGYQYALVYMDEGDAIPALLLAECSWDGIRFVKVFQYDPGKPGLWESLDPLNEYRNMLYLREGGKGLLLWYSDGAYDSGIMEVQLEQYNLKYNELWYGENGTWPDDIPKEDILWTDIQ